MEGGFGRRSTTRIKQQKQGERLRKKEGTKAEGSSSPGHALYTAFRE
jgi:hypothetical protein